jgi:uroporphyrinogen III methyltransferase/synthase
MSVANPSSTLVGRKVALASAAEDAFSPAPALRALGAEVVFYPCAVRLPLDATDALDAALRRAPQGAFDWLIFPTPGAVTSVAERLAALNIAPRNLGQIAAYGAMTRQHMAARLPDLQPVTTPKLSERASHRDFVTALDLTTDARVLLLQPLHARTDWERILQARGAQVTAIAAYRLRLADGGDPLPALLWSGAIDAMVFTSESNVRHFAQRLTHDGGTLAMLDNVHVACIDPPTAATARALGIRVHVIPAHPTPDALAAELGRLFARQAVP